MKLPSYFKLLSVIFVLTLSLVNPLVRGDGVGYYAYVRSLLVQHNLRFEQDWLHSGSPLIDPKVDANGRIGITYTRTGHVINHYSVGPSILWAPFLVPGHMVMVILGKAGLSIKTDGFSKPYRIIAALATALYGFLGLCVSFGITRRYAGDKWTFLATLGMWFASSLPVYMYFNPFYSHAHSVFGVAIFLWYWQRTRSQRTMRQWVILGLIAGMMLNIYYLNIVMLLFPLLESLRMYWQEWRVPGHAWRIQRKLLLADAIFSCAALVAFSPTLITRKIIYGSPWHFDYEPSSWIHPALWQPLLSSNHGLLLWTPIVGLSLAGLILLRRYDRELSLYSLVAFVAMYYIVACHPDWHGISSFGNRFFISLTPLFVLGLAVFLQEASQGFKRTRMATAASALVISTLILWNLAFIFQWGIGIVPHVGAISWKQMAYNQVAVVPQRLGSALKLYFTHRDTMMQRIELQDVQRIRRKSMKGSNKP